MAQSGDIAAISRISEHDYEIRIIRQGTTEYDDLIPYATTFIGIHDKRIGYLNNERFEQETGISLTTEKAFAKLSTHG